MYNHFMMMGRLVRDPEFRDFEDGKTGMNITLAVRKNFKNMDGGYDVEFYRIAFWEFIVDQYKAHLKKGMAVFVKGRLYNTIETLKSGYELTYPLLIGERILYFTSLPKQVEEEEENVVEETD